MAATEKKDSGILILDIPVVHKGYVDLLKKHSDGSIETLYLVGSDILSHIDVKKEIRSNDPETTKRLLSGLDLPFRVEIIGLDKIRNLPTSGIYTARDEVSRRLQEEFFPNAQVTQETAFLRWDEGNVTSTRPTSVDQETKDPFHIRMMERARGLADSSSDWWRRVGVVIVKDGEVLVESYNQAFPTDSKPYVDGNPRDFLKAGTLAFMSSTIHAEPAGIAKAAGKGLNLKGSDLYLNSFPCPPCVMGMGMAGIKRCFNAGGNAYLDASEVMKSLGIENIFVDDGKTN